MVYQQYGTLHELQGAAHAELRTADCQIHSFACLKYLGDVGLKFCDRVGPDQGIIYEFPGEWHVADDFVRLAAPDVSELEQQPCGTRRKR